MGGALPLELYTLGPRTVARLQHLEQRAGSKFLPDFDNVFNHLSPLFVVRLHTVCSSWHVSYKSLCTHALFAFLCLGAVLQ